jgi:COP9 signalosome complex subunit 4
VQNEELELQYKTCYARILDSKRRFLEAATRYYELSQVGKRKIGDHEVRFGAVSGWLGWRLG